MSLPRDCGESVRRLSACSDQGCSSSTVNAVPLLLQLLRLVWRSFAPAFLPGRADPDPSGSSRASAATNRLPIKIWAEPSGGLPRWQVPWEESSLHAHICCSARRPLIRPTLRRSGRVCHRCTASSIRRAERQASCRVRRPMHDMRCPPVPHRVRAGSRRRRRVAAPHPG